MRLAMLLVLPGLMLFSGCSHQPEPSWTRVACPVSDPLHNGFFLDDTHGWIISYGTGVVLGTGDGGESWSVIARLDSIYYEDICFVSPEKGWICGEYGAVLRTEDGGRYWQAEKIVPEDVAFYGMDFTLQERWILVGIDVARRGALIFESRDLGKTWLARPDSLPGMALEPIQFLDGHHGFIGGNGIVLRTTDGGKTWIASDLGQKCMIRGIYFHDLTHGWAVGHNGLVFRTQDGAESWQKLESFTANRLRSVLFIDGQHGCITGDRDQGPGSLWRTTDGGRTWSIVDEAYPDLHRIFPGSDALWAIGKEGVILRYK